MSKPGDNGGGVPAVSPDALQPAPLALILSSFVAASRIGGAAQQLLLAAHGFDPVLVPTVMIGRSPAKGAVGQVTEPDVFARMLADAEAEGLFAAADLVITGHFSSAEQVAIAAETIARVRAAAVHEPVIVVDPIMGDAPNGLYVKPEVARAVASQLVPLADWITPNVWELERLTGASIKSLGDLLDAARRLGRPALVTSAPAGPGQIGLVLVEPSASMLFAHAGLAAAPHGTGDLVAASFGAGLADGLAPTAAAERTARAIVEAVQAAQDNDLSDLPIVALGRRLVHPTAALRIESL